MWGFCVSDGFLGCTIINVESSYSQRHVNAKGAAPPKIASRLPLSAPTFFSLVGNPLLCTSLLGMDSLDAR